MDDLATTILDAVALLLIGAGLAAFAYRWIGWACLAVAGVVILAGSLLADAIAPKQPPG